MDGQIKVNHLNHVDENGNVFCKKLNFVKTFGDLRDQHCLKGCDRLNGSLQGESVECLWDDDDYGYPWVHIHDPYTEFARVNLLGDVSMAIPAHLAVDKVRPARGIYFILIKKIRMLPEELWKHQKQIAANSHVIYIGQADDKQADDKHGLKRRLALQDLQHKRGPSTFFRSVGAVLGYEPVQGSLKNKTHNNYVFTQEDTMVIRKWISSYLYVTVKEIPFETLDGLEKGLIKSFSPCFNIAHNPEPCAFVIDQRNKCLTIARQ